MTQTITNPDRQENKEKTMATYLALTSINPAACGYRVVAYGSDAQAVETAARNAIGAIMPEGTAFPDIHKETEHINLRVVSKTAAKRAPYRIDVDHREYGWYILDDAIKTD